MSEKGFDVKPVEVFTATCNLRWLYPKNGPLMRVSRLQQGWIGSFGTVEWRDIEWVSEE